jgi:hypothetical protein
MRAAVELLELCTEIIWNICDSNAAQAPAQCCGWYCPKRPQTLSDVIVARCLADNANELSCGNAEGTENRATDTAADLILTDATTGNHSTRNVDHPWKHAQAANLYLRRSRRCFSQIEWRHRPNENKISHR